jgi:hypothetical protein
VLDSRIISMLQPYAFVSTATVQFINDNAYTMIVLKYVSLEIWISCRKVEIISFRAISEVQRLFPRKN